MEAVIAVVVEGVDLSWGIFAAGALGAPCLWRRLIYTVQFPPCDGPVNGAKGSGGRPGQTSVSLLTMDRPGKNME